MTDGLQERNFVYVDDVTDAVIKAAKKHDGFREFNLGCGEGVQVADVIMRIARYLMPRNILNWVHAHSA